MGTQQILLIVLSVIIVGIAAAVGITMFNTQAETSNRQAILMDLQNFSSHSQAFYKTPRDLGGGGQGTPGFSEEEDIKRYLGFGTGTEFVNDNGSYQITANTATNLTILGIGKERGTIQTDFVKATLFIDMNQVDVDSVHVDN